MSTDIRVSKLQLTAEQLLQVEKLAGCNYSPEKIAMYLNIDKKSFLDEWHLPESDVRFHYERGVLIVQAESDMSLADSARKGNITAYQQYTKQSVLNKLDNIKKKLILDQELQTIEKIKSYLDGGKSITDKEVKYYEQIDLVRCLFIQHNSRSYIINAICLSYKDINRRQANEIYTRAINFFYLDNDIKAEAWANIYADRLDNAAAICFEMNDFDNYDRYIKEAAKYRGVGKDKPTEIPEGFYDRRPVLYTIDPEKFKVKRVNRRQIAEWISNLPDLSEEDRLRLDRDLMMEDVEYEIVETPSNE